MQKSYKGGVDEFYNGGSTLRRDTSEIAIIYYLICAAERL